MQARQAEILGRELRRDRVRSADLYRRGREMAPAAAPLTKSTYRDASRVALEERFGRLLIKAGCRLVAHGA